MTGKKGLLQQVAPNAEQAPAVNAQGHDVVVTAGAGAGKTRTLVARYLRLLEDGTPPHRIAAITFTRKAAREMRNRIRQAIGDYVRQAPLPAGERDRWETVQRDLDAARIGTIHELCAQILRTHPAAAGVDPRFRMLEEGASAWLRHQVTVDSLAWAVEQPGLHPLFTLVGATRLPRLLETLLAQRLEAEAALSNARGKETEWQRYLAAEAAGRARVLLEMPAVQEALVDLQAHRPLLPDDHLAQMQALALQAVAGAGAAPERGWERLASLDTITLNRGSQKAWPGGKEEKQAVSTALGALRAAWRASAGKIEPACNDADRELAALQPLLALLFAHAEALYTARKAEQQALDFDDLEAMALAVIRTEPEVSHYWRQQLDEILVDEYQDTNERQRQIINLLHRGSLFLVGDAKQSIYRFRGARVDVFREEEERIRDCGGSSHTLSTSYRPHHALLEGLNRLLPAVMVDQGQGASGHVAFAPLRHQRELPDFGLDGPFIELELGVGTKEAALPRAAAACAGRIAELVERHEALHYRDVAILCRSSGSFGTYEDALEARHIPYQIIAGRGFYERPEVRDLLNALHAILDPADDLALYGFLRSPVVGFDDATLYQLRRRQLQEQSPALWQTLCQMEGETARRAVTLLGDLRNRAGRLDAATLLQRLLLETDYVAALHRADRQRAARNVTKFLAEAQQAGIVHVHDFLAYVRDVQKRVRASEARATVEDAVQIMTIHQAKGLQFPVVVVGDLNRAQPSRETLLVVPELGVLFQAGEAEPAIYRLAKETEQAQEAAEAQRVFYVAATRARDKLLLNGHVGLQQGKASHLSGWLKQLLPPLGLAEGIDEETEEGQTRQVATTIPAVACTFYGKAYRPPAAGAPPGPPQPRLPGGWQPRLTAAIRRAAIQEKEQPSRVWRVVPADGQVYAPTWVVGALVHEALAAWRFPPRRDDPVFTAWIAARARLYGIGDAARLQDATQQTTLLLRRLLAHPLFARLDAARRYHEIPYTYESSTGFEEGKIDLLFADESGWHLIDFKTDQVRDLEHHPRRVEYEAQVRRYARAVQHLAAITPDCTLCWLNYRNQIREQPITWEADGLEALSRE